MPEISVDKDDHSCTREDEVWRSRQARRVLPVSQAAGEAQAPYRELRLSISLPDARHGAPTLCRGHVVWHWSIPSLLSGGGTVHTAVAIRSARNTAGSVDSATYATSVTRTISCN